MGAQGCTKEAGHSEGASLSGLQMMRSGTDRLLEDRKARVVGQSWCQVARRMACWAAKEDDECQMGADNIISNPAPEISMSSNAVLPVPLLGGGQGKRENIQLVAGEREDGGGVGTEKWRDRDGEAGDGDNGTMEIMGDKQRNLISGALHPTNSRDYIRPSDTSPKIKGAHLRASEMTPPQNGDTLLVNGVPTPPIGMVNERA
jgi:hypothetical protein